ncbi:MAG: hypothetical protein ACO37X_10185, partial [Ilumatobacteraceae bacterium]
MKPVLQRSTNITGATCAGETRSGGGGAPRPKVPRPFRIAVVGATGVVGRETIAILKERNFPVAELRLLASD